jgi:hypothetical protein
MKVYSLKELREVNFRGYWQLVYPGVTALATVWIDADKLEPDIVYGYIAQVQGQSYVRLRHDEGV